MKTNLKFYRTSVRKSTFRKQKDTDKANAYSVRQTKNIFINQSVIYEKKAYRNNLCMFLEQKIVDPVKV